MRNLRMIKRLLGCMLTSSLMAGMLVACGSEQKDEVSALILVLLGIFHDVFHGQLEALLASGIARCEGAELAVARARGGVQADLRMNLSLAVCSCDCTAIA